MHIHLHTDPLPYYGPELTSHFIYNHFGLRGDAMVAFAGPCRVQLNDMVDLEDVHADAPIFSELMLHFLIEHFQTPLETMVLRQRLLTAQIQNLLHAHGQNQIRRSGDDLYDAKNKLSVSIATVSPVSGLIHFGINISSANTPVSTRGLADYEIDWQTFAQETLNAYAKEDASIRLALTKVRWVH
ncbi:DUF366 domain-containing protein [bacterium (Candidatus Blackallbacteria) CG17_big_fil_post_rev_8_21_14_2_50_48_46]|uniref:DUF366 domain-containing protein n=1 Tax=bacterium (Candidatus Blackallbacteria) CG17_big_fil_post_rev_8_21_14_2_50_48_46 TaxID=2014261 RepID=A0A2M7FXJ6_9BACT|nr:MAG: hypothetical protein COW64_17555 [bacterium (Candidatus Blackallbacteria) CG18_big_fil_WC_8_21_14_2_50_49_26]PIW13978.1 MAG: DUF366 domain-containing protein [bacterium (Candidatus Blackallbacteria) CG17_big_fil_post_rev_8_21_14_2_50_48_46]PIW46829.1 MAG: DUF366 domain-containing protein [bacterium (Candidatus Blackallbacteria) CG13_big_fil_rev_8_21_14_2_50_49_14]